MKSYIYWNCVNKKKMKPVWMAPSPNLLHVAAVIGCIHWINFSNKRNFARVFCKILMCKIK